MLHLRIVSAFIVLACVFTLIGLDALVPIHGIGGLWLLPLGLVFVVGTAWEFAGLVRTKWPVSSVQVSTASGAIFASSALPMLYEWYEGRPYPSDCPIGTLGWPLLSLLIATSYFSIGMMRRLQTDPDRGIIVWALSSLIPLYVGVGASFWVFTRLMKPDSWSLLCVVGIIAVTKLGDTGAYFIGRAIGKTKLCPSISPGKTVEGAFGGIAFGLLGSIGWFGMLIPFWFGQSFEMRWIAYAAFFGSLLSIVGMLGDLVESTVKRSVQVKDSGRSLPGLGGLWDVTDSILPTAVAGFLGIVGGLVWRP